MKYQLWQFAVLKITNEKVQILACIPKETPGYNLEGYLIRTPSYAEIFVREQELEDAKF